MKTRIATMRNSMECPQEIKNTTTILFNNLTSGYRSKKIKSLFHRDDHRNITHNSHGMGTT